MLRATAWMLLAGLVLPLVVSGQEAPAVPPSGTTPLGVRQQRVERMMEDLERKFKTPQPVLAEDRARAGRAAAADAQQGQGAAHSEADGRHHEAARPDAARYGHRRPEGAAGRHSRAAGAVARREERQRQGPRGIRAAQPVEEADREHHPGRSRARSARATAGQQGQDARRPGGEDQGARGGDRRARRKSSPPRKRPAPKAFRVWARSPSDQGAARQKTEAIANQIAKEAGDEKGPFEAAKPAAKPTGEPKPGPNRETQTGRRLRSSGEGQARRRSKPAKDRSPKDRSR